jgi:isoquinoline 1-oxidoreductase beta subunit
VTLTVNGSARSVEAADPEMPLLWVLRDRLGLRGTKYGCGVGRGLAANVYDGSTRIAQVADVSVGASGDVAVHRIVTAVDCGQPVNPLGVEGQIESGVIWALSHALKGEITLASGRVAETGFAEYPLLTLAETPEVETVIMPSRAAATGIGEIPVPCVAPAVANALFAATGDRVRRIPMRPADLL